MKCIQYSRQKYLAMRRTSSWLFVFLLTVSLLGLLLQSLLKLVLPHILPFLFSLFAMVPGLTIFIAPWISHAWLGGINPLAYPEKPWDELSKWKKFTVYINSIFLLAGSIFLWVVVFSQSG